MFYLYIKTPTKVEVYKLQKFAERAYFAAFKRKYS